MQTAMQLRAGVWGKSHTPAHSCQPVAGVLQVVATFSWAASLTRGEQKLLRYHAH